MSDDPTPHRLAVVGAGVMGIGIATLAVGRGLPVLLVDVDADRLAAAPDLVRQRSLEAHLLGGLGTDGPPGALTTSPTVADVAGATAVVESVTEIPELKLRVLAEVSAAVRPGTLLTSNTSAIPIGELAGALARPEELVGTHFMNPPYLIRTVEVVRGPATGDAALKGVLGLLESLDCRALVVGDGPGFVSNRILMLMINNAARLVDEGRAGAAEVDAVFTGCLGHRTGPLATADLIGLDNVVDTLRVLQERTGDDGYRPAAGLTSRVDSGDLGRKSGRGFFDHGRNRP